MSDIGKTNQEPEEDLYDICHVCKGGSDSSGPYKCWYCLGTHVNNQKNELIEPD